MKRLKSIESNNKEQLEEIEDHSKRRIAKQLEAIKQQEKAETSFEKSISERTKMRTLKIKNDAQNQEGQGLKLLAPN